MFKEIAYYSRMARGLYDYVSRPVHADPVGAIREQMEQRDGRFLSMLRAIVYADANHPYHRMLRMAGCAHEDVARMVSREGLEGALSALLGAGVYLTHDEFKGKQPIVRSGREIAAGPGAFVNPLVCGRWENPSSGSTGARVATAQSGEYRVYRDCYDFLIHQEFSTKGRRRAISHAILPSPTGIIRCLGSARVGLPFERWYSVGGSVRDAQHYRVVTRFLALEARLLGTRIPLPEYLPNNDFSPAAKWLAQCRAEGTPGFLVTIVGAASRIACAAADAGLDIRGSMFYVGGEALTEAKRARIEATGSEVSPHYISSELGAVGTACRQMSTGNSVHLFRDGMAVVEVPRQAPLSGAPVNSLAFTTLLPSTPRFLINYEIFDHGVVEKATCDCTYSRIGFREQIRDLYSFAKVTGHGATLTGADLIQIVEEVLPMRFGGGPGDYQLTEEDTGSQTRLRLVVRPGASARSSEDVRTGFLEAVGRLYGGSLAVRQWKHADSVVVVRAEPFATQSGKVPSLHLLGRGRGGGNEA